MQKMTEHDTITISNQSGWWLTYPSEKYESQLGWLIIPNIWNNKIHVPNHQPAISNH